ncbi:MAG: hypothetical protein B7Y98_09545 [Sphingomonas sp. 32-62-10]|nr:MAG: hypothetical protein B7Z43_06650 [Sphingomonas sp. 12-62-6]OYX38253.1 MAG: hypothetical protein B7Y98_09545 [Sphingomonas sp. 32-62-10]
MNQTGMLEPDMRHLIHAAIIATALTAPLAPATATPVRVTRFHLGTPITPAPASIQVGTGSDPQSLEQQQFAGAVAAELARLGFTPEAANAPAPLLVTVTFTRREDSQTAARPPISIGLGGGSFGGGVGGGVGLGFGVGKRPTRTIYTTELFVQLRQRSDGAAIWEGRAVMVANAKAKDAQPGVMSEKLARALFRGFPGESGRTITVR